MAKYTITIADIDLNIQTEESPEMVQTLVSTLDRRLRDILIRSPRLAKSEAAILCAIDDCAERMKSDDKAAQMEKEYIRLSKELETLRIEHSALTGAVEDLRRENRIMNDIITKSVSTAYPAVDVPTSGGEQLSIKAESEPAAPAEEPAPAPAPAEDKPVPVKTEEVVPATKVMFQNEQPSEDDPPVRKIRRRTPPKTGNQGKNKVGDMFDLLTFKDV